MNIRDITKELHAMITARLFSPRPWLADRDACEALRNKLDELGLRERVSEDTARATVLGLEFKLDLVMVFIGLWDEWEVPGILVEYGLIDEPDEERLYDLLASSGDPERALRPIVRKAFRDHYNPSGRLV